MFAQSPQGVGYQGVATDLNGVELINQAISIQASVLSSSATGNVEWQEEHSVTTDAFGLFTLTIGQGTSTGNGSTTNFADISWGSATHFLKIEMDVNGGTNYSLMGTNQMMSVPYALYAENANINYDSIATILSNDSSFTNVFGSSCTSFDTPQTTFNWTFNLNSTSTHFQESLEDGFFGGQMNCGSQYQGVFEVWDDTTSNSYIYNYNISNGVSTFLIPIKKGQFFRKIGTCIQVNFFIPLVCEGSSSSSLDSTTIANMIASAGGGYDFLFPEGYNGEVITSSIPLGASYTVPSGKKLYLTQWRNGDPKISTINEYLQFSSTNGKAMILNSGESLSSDNNGASTSYFQGILIDDNPNVQAITSSIPVGSSYTVPSGKKLYILYWRNGDPKISTINEYFQFSPGNDKPLILNSGESLSADNSGSLTSYFNGYLVDDDYFSNLSGGNNNNSSSISDTIYTGDILCEKTRFNNVITKENIDTIALPYKEGEVLYVMGKVRYPDPNDSIRSSFPTGFYTNGTNGSIYALRFTDDNFNPITAKVRGSCEGTSASDNNSYYDINKIYSKDWCQHFTLEIIPKNNNTGMIYIFIEQFIEQVSGNYDDNNILYYQY